MKTPLLDLRLYCLKEGWKYKLEFNMVIFFILLFLNFGMEVCHIATLDETGSLLRNYWSECIKYRENPLMSYDEFLVKCYKENITESLIIAFLLWVGIIFLIDITEDFLKLLDKQISFKRKDRLELHYSPNIINLAMD